MRCTSGTDDHTLSPSGLNSFPPANCTAKSSTPYAPPWGQGSLNWDLRSIQPKRYFSGIISLNKNYYHGYIKVEIVFKSSLRGCQKDKKADEAPDEALEVLWVDGAEQVEAEDAGKEITPVS